MTATMQSHDRHMTTTMQSHDCHMTTTMQSHDYCDCILDVMFSHTLKPIYFYRWRAKVILLRIPVRDRPEVQLKAIAYGALDQRRPNWGHNRKWTGNYLLQQVSS